MQQEKRSPEELILSVASTTAAQPLHDLNRDVWGVLTAVTDNARKRRQGMNIILTADEHCIGRLIQDRRFQIESVAVSANHCKIYRKKATGGDLSNNLDFHGSVMLKDTSTNGTYLNWEKLTKKGPEAELRHGDIVSFAGPPHIENSFAFVFRDVLKSATGSNGVAKRKADEFGPEGKRLKGIGIGAPDGPLSLDDFRSLQRSNKELRKQLENHVSTIDSLHNENRALTEHHKIEMNEIKASVEKCYSEQLQELHRLIEVKHKDLEASNKSFSEQKHAMVDLNERLTAYSQSIAEAKEIIACQKASITKIKEQLDNERDQRREEREKAAQDLKAAVLKAQSEAEEELKRLSEASSRRDSEQQEVINKLQESEKERCFLVDTLRTKLEDSRQKLVASENNMRQLEIQLSEEKLIYCNKIKRIDELEDELKTTKEKLENEKAAREEAWAKVSVLELEISAALRDLELERRRLRGARERIILRETQLRAFYSTTEEISSLFAKQQEQLKAMQKTLEDEENYASDSAEIDLNVAPGATMRNYICGNKQLQGKCDETGKAGSYTSANRCGNIQADNSSDDACGTEKHDCDHNTQEDLQNSQEVDSGNVDPHARAGICGDMYGGGREPVLEGDPIGTEQVPDTESPEADNEHCYDSDKEVVLAGETMQVDDETRGEETEEFAQETWKDPGFSDGQGSQGIRECTKTVAIRTQDLLAPDVVASTTPSTHGDNNDKGVVLQHEPNTIVVDSQHSPSPEGIKRKKRKDEREELSEMIGIVAPELKDHFCKGNINGLGNNLNELPTVSDSSSDTEGIGSEDNHDNNDESSPYRVKGKCRVMNESETDGSDKHSKSEDAMDEDEQEDAQHDSVG